MELLSVSEAKIKLSGLVEALCSTDEKIIVTKTCFPGAVLTRPEDYDSVKEIVAIRFHTSRMAEIKNGLKALITQKIRMYTLVELFG